MIHVDLSEDEAEPDEEEEIPNITTGSSADQTTGDRRRGPEATQPVEDSWATEAVNMQP